LDKETQCKDPRTLQKLEENQRKRCPRPRPAHPKPWPLVGQKGSLLRHRPTYQSMPKQRLSGTRKTRGLWGSQDGKKAAEYKDLLAWGLQEAFWNCEQEECHE